MTDAFNAQRRNAHALAARQRRAGAHSGRRKPDVFDAINEYEEEHMEVLRERAGRFPDIGDTVRVVEEGKQLWAVGKVVRFTDTGLCVVDFEDGQDQLHIEGHLLECLNG